MHLTAVAPTGPDLPNTEVAREQYFVPNFVSYRFKTPPLRGKAEEWHRSNFLRQISESEPHSKTSAAQAAEHKVDPNRFPPPKGDVLSPGTAGP